MCSDNRSKRLAELHEELNPGEWEAFQEQLHGDASSEWLSGVMRKHGHPISATTIKLHRRLCKEAA